ncbi:hypothetical protein KKH43_01975 [Patescibacteria group bacterium]|nr:hypothetical protein [Patescibacteria group bacterium]
MKVKQSLNSNETLESVQKEVDRLKQSYFWGQNDVNDGLDLLHSLEEKIKFEHVKDPETKQHYNTIVADLRINLFSTFLQEQAEHAIELYFLSAVKQDAKAETPFYSNLDQYAMSIDIFSLEARLESVRKRVMRCKEELGKNPITLDGKKVKSTVENWIKDYTNEVGTGKKIVTIIRKYLTSSPNVRLLSQWDRKVLSRALRYYELLKLRINDVGCLGINMTDWDVSIDDEKRVNSDPFRLKVPEPEYNIDVQLQEEARLAQKSASSTPALPTKPPIAKKPAPQAPLQRKPEVKPSVVPAPLASPVVSIDTLIADKKKQEEGKPSPQVKPEPARRPEQAAPRKPPVPKRVIEQNSEKKLSTLQDLNDLQKITIDYFRSLGSSDAERLTHIKSQIDDLKKNTSSDILQSAWRKSSLYLLYLEIGRRSMSSDKTVADIGKELFNEGKPYLTEREFEMIAELSAHF